MASNQKVLRATALGALAAAMRRPLTVPDVDRLFLDAAQKITELEAEVERLRAARDYEHDRAERLLQQVGAWKCATTASRRST